MRQVRIGFTFLGLMVAGITSAAGTPKEVTLFGQNYTLQRQNLADKFGGVQALPA